MSKGKFGNLAGLLFCALLGIWMLGYWFETAKSVWAHYFGFPVEDYWRSVANLPRYEGFDLTVLGEQHNEHRVAVPEIIFAIDTLYLRAHEYLPIWLSACCQLGTFWLLAITLWAERRVQPALRVAMICLCGILLGWPGIAYVISWPFLIVWTLVQLLVTAALVLLTRRRLAVPLICGFIATFTAGHGMLIWPVLLLASFALGGTRKHLAAIGLTGTASVALYFYRLVPSVDAQTHLFSQNLSWFFGFLASMLSMPFSADRRMFGLWLGPISLVLFIVILCVAWRKRLLRDPVAVTLFGLCIFSLATILICGMGRTLPTYWEYPTAKVARYLSIPIGYWVSLMAVTIWVLARGRTHAWQAWTALVLFACGMALELPRLNPWLNKQMDYYSRAESSSVALETGVTCLSAIAEDLYPHPEQILPWNAALKKRGLSVYSGGQSGWVGRRISELLTVDEIARRNGTVSTALASSCSMQVAGWMEGGERNLVLVNENGVIAGLGRRFRAELPLYLPNRWTGVKENWTGFINYGVPSKSIQPFVILSQGHTAIPVGSPVPVPPPDKRGI